MTDQRISGSTMGRGLLALCGAYQVALGAYFILLRPSFLPEDLRFIHSSAAAVRAAAPGLDTWLQWVFMVMGGQMVGVGMLVLLAVTDRRGPIASVGKLALLGLAAASTTLLMGAVNFAVGSDFRWMKDGGHVNCALLHLEGLCE